MADTDKQTTRVGSQRTVPAAGQSSAPVSPDQRQSQDTGSMGAEPDSTYEQALSGGEVPKGTPDDNGDGDQATSSFDDRERDEDQIRNLAYAFWEEEGRPDGRDQDHWHRARETRRIR